MSWQCTGRSVQARARKCQQQTQDLAAVALRLLGRRHRRITTDAALPDSIADARLAWRLAGDSEAREEEQVNQSVDELLGQGLGILEAVLRRRSIIAILATGLGLGFVKEHLTHRRCSRSRAFPPHRPEETLFPGVQRVALVDVGQHPCQNTHAVEEIAFWGDILIRKSRMLSQQKESRCDG